MAEYVVEFGKDGRPVEPDGRLDAAAFHRNHQPIWATLQKFLDGKSGDVLEAGSGTGQHVVDFARRSPQITWWPSDLNDAHLKSINAWRAHAKLRNQDFLTKARTEVVDRERQRLAQLEETLEKLHRAQSSLRTVQR